MATRKRHDGESLEQYHANLKHEEEQAKIKKAGMRMIPFGTKGEVRPVSERMLMQIARQAAHNDAVRVVMGGKGFRQPFVTKEKRPELKGRKTA